MTAELAEYLRDLLERQCGVLTRAQALGNGMTRKQVEARLRSGRWQRLHPGVYATFSGDPRRPAVLWAAVLRAGDEAVLSHHTAAELQALSATPSRAIHVMVPSGQLVSAIGGVALHYSRRVSQARHPARTPPQTRIEETALDLAAGAASLDEALSWLLRACGSRKTTPDRIAAAMALRRRVRWRTELSAALGPGAHGVHSLLEFRYVTRVERPHGLPAATRQYQVTRPASISTRTCSTRRMAWWSSWTGWWPTRLNSAGAIFAGTTPAPLNGQQTLRYGWADVTEEPCHVAAQVGGVLAGRGWGGRLRRCGRTCQLPADPPSSPGRPRGARPRDRLGG